MVTHPVIELCLRVFMEDLVKGIPASLLQDLSPFRDNWIRRDSGGALATAHFRCVELVHKRSLSRRRAQLVNPHLYK